MLDDPTYIAKYDRGDSLAMIASQGEQLRTQFEFDVPEIKDVRQIVVAGMGGSALAAEFARSWLADRLPIPIEIVRGYDLPAYANEHSVIVISSFSGNTEEALSCLEQAQKRGAAIVIMTAGGELAKQADEFSFLKIPHSVSQPRLAVLSGVKALVALIEQLGLIEDDLSKELETAAEWLLAEIENFLPTVAEADNPAKQITTKLVGHPLVVYGGPVLAMPALKWKIDFNENGKNLAFYYEFPEFNHNEIVGWANPKDSPLRVIELRSSLDHPRVQKRFDLSNEVLAGQMPAPIVVEAQGETALQQMLWTMLLGDFTSAYLAFMNKADPEPVEILERFKKEMKR